LTAAVILVRGLVRLRPRDVSRLGSLTAAPVSRAQRGQYGEERYEKLEMQARVRDNFMALMAQDPRWRVVDGVRPIEDVHRDIVRLVTPAIAAAAHDRISTLWK
jgi:dTMP kinase